MNDETSALDAYCAQLDALLEGGPADIPRDLRERMAEPGDGKIKLPHNGGYEHFERTEEHSGGFDGRPRRVYRWVTRTRIAE
ncbi:MAG TPA: DUF5988 family protein [Actinocrinis sp.]|nr:DUF5988 family protein [Actinocrinis sp.]